jgi:hypothetical protein
MTSTSVDTKLADLLVPFAEAANIRARDVSATLRKRVILALPFADTQALHDTLFPKDTIDWAQARAFLAETACSTDEWLLLIALMHFLNEPPTRTHVSEMVAAASAGLRLNPQQQALTPIESMQLCFARAGFIPTWDLLCKSLLCANLSSDDVDVQHALEKLLTTSTEALPKLKKTPAAIAETVMRHLPAYKHSRDEYTQAFAHILAYDNCHVAAHFVLRAIKAREDIRARTRSAAIASFQGAQKPSLTRLLMQFSSDDDDNNAVDGFQRFCRAARLPVSSHPRLLQTCYYITCMPVRATDAYPLLFPDDETSARLLAEQPTPQTPELAPLLALATSVQHFGEPCAALRQFRAQRKLDTSSSWTTLLRLFLAAHCPLLWPHVVATLPPAQQHALSVVPTALGAFPVADLVGFMLPAV